MEDWEDENNSPLNSKELLKNQWDDEDVNEDDIKESWEDEDEPAPAATFKPVQEQASSKPAPSKPVAKKGKNNEPVKEEEPLDPLAEKLRQQRLVEEADYKSTTELFAVKGDQKSLENFIPKSENDFVEYAEFLSHKIRPYEKSFHYIGLLKSVMRLAMTNMKAADAKEVASSITAIANEKLKAEKEAAAGKKKTGGKKKQLHVDKADDGMVAGAYDALDDYDFM